MEVDDVINDPISDTNSPFARALSGPYNSDARIEITTRGTTRVRQVRISVCVCVCVYLCVCVCVLRRDSVGSDDVSGELR